MAALAPRLLLVALLATALVVGVVTVAELLTARDRPVIAPDRLPAEPAPAREEVRAAEVLRDWDAARADAWADGDVRRLASLYTPGSAAGRRDRAMLAAWQRRGLVVRNLQTQVLALREIRRTEDAWVLRVTDRVAGGTATGRDLTSELPTDAATTTTLTLRQVDGRWLVARVRRAPA